MVHRTTLILDDDTWTAARELAQHYDCTLSEAIRRAVIRHRDAVTGAPQVARKQRTRTLHRLFELFEHNDPAQEVRRLKAEDEGS
ncbi:MAG TPA: hypothetical protein VLF66_03675 [Thermoanaerobaculia bacterium]|nr:hypothetical protein [Thermoanaerobaculia bacterium]